MTDTVSMADPVRWDLRGVDTVATLARYYPLQVPKHDTLYCS